ncbi:MAG: autotransporter domain-containing protein [Elusimicrobia bacterium]|nr:autotransporter domain-containing protein [Elusimicrobiota bacterium]
MNLKKIVAFFVLGILFISTGFAFAEEDPDLKLEQGKNLLFDFVNATSIYQSVDKGVVISSREVAPGEWEPLEYVRQDAGAQWYNTERVYDNVNIGAGSKVVLDSAWETVFVSSSSDIFKDFRVIADVDDSDPAHPVTSSKTVEYDNIVTTYTYSMRERLATLSIASTGTIVLNNGSELSIRNEYSLITSSGDISLKYRKTLNGHDKEVYVVDHGNITTNEALEYICRNDKEELDFGGTSINMKINEDRYTKDNLFTGDIIFERGDSDTILTFRGVSEKDVSEKPGNKAPSATKPWLDPEKTESGGDITHVDVIEIEEEMRPADSASDDIEMRNKFIINANRAVFNVETDWNREPGSPWLTTDGGVYLINPDSTGESSNISGPGNIVKQGNGVLVLFSANANDLKGTSTGYGWTIEEGMITAVDQINLGKSAISVDKDGTLGLFGQRDDEGRKILTEYSNNITLTGGEISIASISDVNLSGNLSGEQAHFTLYKDSTLVLSGKNDNISEYYITFGGKSGGYNNYLISDVKGLARDCILAKNITDEEYKDTAFFQLILDENENKLYSGSLQGDMYLQKTGTGTVTLSGENTYTMGTYITEGGLLLATANSVGQGKIMFNGSSSTYAVIGVSGTVKEVDLKNDIHVRKGAIFDVIENQTFNLSGSIENYDARLNDDGSPMYPTEIIKKGLGNVVIAKSEEGSRKINITTFTVNAGSFTLDDGVVLDSYFSLDGDNASLEMRQNAGITNKIDIFNGDLTIFNEKNVSSVTAIVFHSTATSRDSFSKLHITSDTVISNETMPSGTINIAKNIEFVTDATTTAKLDKFIFDAGNDKIIAKSGEGIFIADNNSENFVAKDLYVTAGDFRLENTNMNVSSTTLIDGGILSVSSTSHFASTAASAEDKKITVLSGGIGIYNGDSIDNNTKLIFEGTDTVNLSKLVIEAEGVQLKNDISVKAGINIQNEKDFSFAGNKIDFDPHYAGILAKSGAGTMTINTDDVFTMGELRALEGNLLVTSDINVSTISVLGEKALLSFEGVESAAITETLVLSEGGTLSVSTSTLTIGNIALDSATITNTASNINVEKNLVLSSSTLSLLETNSNVSAGGDIGFSSSTIALFGEGSQIKGMNNIGFSSSTINLSAKSAKISAENDIGFEKSIINLSSDSVSINATNNIYFVDSKLNLSTNTGINATTINFDSSTIVFSTASAILNAKTVNLNNGSALTAFGKITSDLNVGKGSCIKIGKEKSIDTLQTKSVVFESDSSLYIDINSANGVMTTDKLEVEGDITVHKNSTLYVNLMGDESDYNTSSNVNFAEDDSDSVKEFEFLTFSGNYSFDNTTNEIFNIVLSNPRLSASTALIEKSIFLRLAQEWSVYDIPGVTKNQESMINVFNKIYADTTAKESMKSVLSTLDAIYSTYRTTGDKTEFINALQDLSGIFYANSFMTSAMLSKANIIYNRLNDFSKERENNNNVWVQVYTNNFSVAENEENPKFENSIYGVIAGYDTVSDDNLVFGVAGFYGQGELKQVDDKADVMDAGVNVYGDYKINENIDIKGLVGYSMQDYDTTRNLRFIKQEIKSKYATNTISLDLEAAYRYDLSEKLSLKPLVGANCAIVSNGDIEEDGDTDQKLKIDKNSYTKADVRVGVGLQSRAVSPFNWYVLAAVKQIVTGDKFTTKSSFVKASDYEFEIESTKLASTSFVGNLGCSYDINSSFNVSLDLNADTGSASGFGANVGATYRW